MARAVPIHDSGLAVRCQAESGGGGEAGERVALEPLTVGPCVGAGVGLPVARPEARYHEISSLVAILLAPPPDHEIRSWWRS